MESFVICNLFRFYFPFFYSLPQKKISSQLLFHFLSSSFNMFFISWASACLRMCVCEWMMLLMDLINTRKEGCCSIHESGKEGWKNRQKKELKNGWIYPVKQTEKKFIPLPFSLPCISVYIWYLMQTRKVNEWERRMELIYRKVESERMKRQREGDAPW